MRLFFLLLLLLALCICSHGMGVRVSRLSSRLSVRHPLPPKNTLFHRGGRKKPKAKKASSREPVDTGDADVPKDELLDPIDGNEEEGISVNPNQLNGINFDSALEGLSKIPLLKSVVAAVRSTPPISQLFLASSIAITVLSAVFNNNAWPASLHFDWKSILLHLQPWRLVTAFLYFGPLNMFYPLTIQFVWQHMSQLEKLNHKTPEEFFVLLLFGCASLIGLYTVTGIPMANLGHNLATYLAYIWSRVFEGSDVNFMDMFTLKAEMLPWFFCLQTMILERDVPIADLIGIAVGHLYFFLQQRKRISTPAYVRAWFSSEDIKKRYAKFTKEFEQ